MCDKRRNRLQDGLLFGYFLFSCVTEQRRIYSYKRSIVYNIYKNICTSSNKMLSAVTLTKFSIQTTKPALHRSNDPVLICLPLKRTERQLSILVKSLCSPPEYSHIVRSAVARSVALYFNLLRHLKADTVCLPLVSAQWPFWLPQTRGLPNSITR